MVYVSFAPRDLGDAISCHSILLESGQIVWTPAQNYKPGEARIKAIKDSSKFILIASPLSRQSRLCKIEKEIAVSFNVPCYSYDPQNTLISPDFEPIPPNTNQPNQINSDEPYIPQGSLQLANPADVRDVFISFSSKDEEDVNTIRAAFRSTNIQWWDFIASDRQFDLRMDQEIEKAISSSLIFLAVQSDNYERSDICTNEYEFAVALGKRILHTQFKPMRPTLRTVNRTYIDCLNNRQEGLKKVVDAVKKLKTSSVPI